MANTYVLISSSTVGSGGAASITLSSIPATYTDLKLVLSARGSQTAAYSGAYLMQVGNGSVDTAANYSWKEVYGSGSAAGSVGLTAQTSWDLTQGAGDSAGNTASTFTNIEIYLPNYAAANAKSMSCDFVSEGNTTAGYQMMIAGLWSGTSAINIIKIGAGPSNTFVQYSTAYIYGIKNS